MKPVKVGIIGCGVISGVYLNNSLISPDYQVVACADMVVEKAQARAAEFGVPKAFSVEELLADPEVELVLNLTIPNAHGPVALAAIEAGKSVYNEKPLALSRAEGRQLVAEAAAKGVLVGGAPDTFMGAGMQTCRKLIDDGAIGDPVAATAFMMGAGHESWHPDPAFYYQRGGGPMFDMGPYYLTALINVLGPVTRVSGATRVTYPERTITSKPKSGQKIQVDVPTHVAGLMNFAGGAIGTMIMSFDIWGATLPRIEIYGTKGCLSVPDPNTFGGAVRLLKAGEKEWIEVAHTHGNTGQGRGLGVADMARALRSGRAARANGELCYHVLDIMHAFHDSSNAGRHWDLESSCTRPAALAPGLADWMLD